MASRSLNKATIIGNLTRDVELRYTANGAAIATFGVATNREYSPSNSDETVEDTEFHNIVAWSKLAELCDKLLSKGQKVYIEGRLQTRNWVDEASAKKMYRTEIVAEEMIVLSSKREDSSYESNTAAQSGDVSTQGAANSNTDATTQEGVNVNTTGDQMPF